MRSSSDLLQAGLAASWVRQVGWSRDGSLHRVGGLLVALGGGRDQTQQVAVVDAEGGAPVVVGDPEAAVVAAEVLFEGAGWDPAVDLLDGVHPHLEEVLEARGYRVVASRPGMVVQADDPLPDLSSPVAVRRAVAADRGAVISVQADAFGLSRKLIAAMLPEAAFADDGVEILVARGARRAVIGSVTAHVDGEVGGIVGAGVMSRHRRRGAGLALTLAALESVARRGAHGVWLQASPDGAPLYRQVGFREVGPCRVWVAPRRSPGSH